MSDICLRQVYAMNPEGEFDGPVDIAVRGGAIERIGRDLPASDLADLDEFAGLWVMPGLFDCHAHLACVADDTLRYLQMPVTQWTLELAANARRLLEMGVTHVRDPGGADVGIRDGIAQGLVPGPRLQVSISCMSQTGGHADGFLAGPGLEMDSGFLGHNHPGRPPYLADGEDGMRLAVRKVLRAGADWIKLCTTGGLLSTALDHPDEAEFTPEEIAVAVGEAGRKGKPVMAHAYGGEGLTNAVQGGVRSVEHGLNLTERQAAEMADRGCWLVPTLSVMYELARIAHAGSTRRRPRKRSSTSRRASARRWPSPKPPGFRSPWVPTISASVRTRGRSCTCTAPGCHGARRW